MLLKKKQKTNKIVRLQIICLGLNYLPNKATVMSWNMFKNNLNIGNF